MIQDINEQFNLPKFTDNKEQFAGPAEKSLYDLDNVGKINTGLDEQDNSFMLDKQAKSVYETLSPIAKEEKITAFIDDKGNLYEEDSPIVKETALQQEFPDPPTEEEKAKKKDELKKLMDDEIAGLGTEADDLIKLGGLSENRRDKYIQKKTEGIQQNYKQQYEDFTKGVLKDYTKKNKTEKQLLAAVNDVSKSLETKLKDADNAILGLDLSRISIHSKDNTNPEFEEKYQEMLNKGISSYEQFSDAFQKGKIPDGSVFRVFDDRGYRSSVMTPYAKPVYYQAFTAENGEKRIDKIAEGSIDPITGQVSAVAPISNLSAVQVIKEYLDITDYETLKRNISERTDITEPEKSVKLKNLEGSRNKGLAKVGAAYDATVSPYSNLSKNVKLAIIASTYPNQFKEKYAEFSAEEKAGETASDRVLNAFGGILVSPITAVTAVAGVAEKGVTELSRFMQGKPEGVLPTGTLALEIQKNPELAKAIDDVITEAGDKAGMYLNSVEGVSNLVASAKVKLNNKID